MSEEKYNWDVRCADLELKRLQDGFTSEDHANFMRPIILAFARVTQSIHIETGSLLSSSKLEMLRAGKRKWEAQIKVGGLSAGVKNPVEYAVSELFGRSPKHGGPPSHDYLRSTKHIDDDYVGPVTSFFSRGRNTPHPENTRGEV